MVVFSFFSERGAKSSGLSSRRDAVAKISCVGESL